MIKQRLSVEVMTAGPPTPKTFVCALFGIHERDYDKFCYEYVLQAQREAEERKLQSTAKTGEEL